MQIVFINYWTYIYSSGVHIHFIANEMTRMGHECTVVVPSVENVDYFGVPEYSFSSYDDFTADVDRGRYGAETILHAWTPRESVRIPTQFAAKKLNAPYFVHMEDNERRILEAGYQKNFRELVADAAAGRQFNLDISHPILHQTFLAEANGVSLLMDRLADFVPSSVPTQLIWPACEQAFFQLPPAPDLAKRAKFGLPPDAAVLVYPGNIHETNMKTVIQMYRALPLVEAAGHKARILRCCGEDMISEADIIELRRRYVVEFPALQSRKLPEAMSTADLLVQPGVADAFDEYRFPSKLPLFLASGRPVILARTNIGRFLDDGKNCLILAENTPRQIADKIIWILEHPAEAQSIGHNGRKFAAKNFNWTNTAKKLLNFYAANSQMRR